MTDVMDGNAAAGVLTEVLTAEITAAITTCGSCGDSRPLGELRAHLGGPGAVLRCATCGAVQARVVRAPGRAWLDLRGIQTLQVELP